MKLDTHPKYTEIEITCACGAKYATRSTEEKVHVEIFKQGEVPKQLYYLISGYADVIRDGKVVA
jgi:hypothetical protein